MSNYLKFLIVSLVVCLGVLVSCDQKKTEIDTSDCLSDMNTIEVRVHMYDNSDQVTEAYKEHLERTGRKWDGLPRDGFAWWFQDEPYYCDVHVRKLRYLEDPRMTDWGHEFAHCICRSYHEDGQR